MKSHHLFTSALLINIFFISLVTCSYNPCSKKNTVKIELVRPGSELYHAIISGFIKGDTKIHLIDKKNCLMQISPSKKGLSLPVVMELPLNEKIIQQLKNLRAQQQSK